MPYELYYWPTILGRGEFVRLALEAGSAEYLDVARLPEHEGLGMPALLAMLEDPALKFLPFAPPFLKAGQQVIGQTANILWFLGARLGLAPRAEAGRLWVHQLQLTISDLVTEVHDTHHPIATTLYYEEQKSAARRRALDFTTHRLPKFLGYFEEILKRNSRRGAHLVGARLSYLDLSLFQVIAGLRYAFPSTMRRVEPAYPGLIALHDRVASLARVAAYLASPRRLPFSEDGIFRHYPELDCT